MAVTVVVPVRNRRAMLRQLLDGLRAQTFDDYEVVVVDDHSDDGSDEEAEKAAADGAPVRLVRNPGRGAVAARMTGVTASESEYLAFIDSDCVPAAGWLSAGVSALANGADVVTGLTRPMRPVAPLERSIAAGEEGLFPTCNVFYRRTAFDAEGGFDADAARRHGFAVGRRMTRLGGGEDVLLGWRVRRAGTAAFAADAIVEHQVFAPDLAESFRRAAMLHGFAGLVREIPELRDTPVFRHRVFLGQRSRVPVYAAAVAVVSRRPRLAAAAAVWWMGARARELRRCPGSRSRKLAAVPAEMALDAVGAVALLVGSARTRTLVL
jgi:glycosyltransferase involved in cell wall biosynthesis